MSAVTNGMSASTTTIASAVAATCRTPRRTMVSPPRSRRSLFRPMRVDEPAASTTAATRGCSRMDRHRPLSQVAGLAAGPHGEKLGQDAERHLLRPVRAQVEADLALAWVEEDCGAGLAHEAARELVLFLRRPGGQPQVSVSLASQASDMTSIRELQVWIAEHLETRLSVEDLADRMAMNVRNFERVFTREVGTTPSQYVLQMRVEAARRHLERTDRGLKHVASAAGFGSVDVMRRAFVRLLGITPARYRDLVARPKRVAAE